MSASLNIPWWIVKARFTFISCPGQSIKSPKEITSWIRGQCWTWVLLVRAGWINYIIVKLIAFLEKFIQQLCCDHHHHCASFYSIWHVPSTYKSYMGNGKKLTSDQARDWWTEEKIWRRCVVLKCSKSKWSYFSQLAVCKKGAPPISGCVAACFKCHSCLRCLLASQMRSSLRPRIFPVGFGCVHHIDTLLSCHLRFLSTDLTPQFIHLIDDRVAIVYTHFNNSWHPLRLLAQWKNLRHIMPVMFIVHLWTLYQQVELSTTLCQHAWLLVSKLLSTLC